jgi:cob(I)alamin adenosyltransferase
MKIYTKSGDKGKTALVSGTRVSKADLRLNCYGEMDELNSFLGFALTNQTSLSEVELQLLLKIQNELFVAGSCLATEADKREQLKLPALDLKITEELESAIDDFSKELPELKNFILPGGTDESTRFNLCRVVCRRVERSLVALETTLPGEVPHEVNIFINRLSDYFFVLGRYVNYKLKTEEVIWKGRE